MTFLHHCGRFVMCLQHMLLPAGSPYLDRPWVIRHIHPGCSPLGTCRVGIASTQQIVKFELIHSTDMHHT